MTREEELARQQRDALAKEVFVAIIAKGTKKEFAEIAADAFGAADAFWKAANELPRTAIKPKVMSGNG